LLSSGIACRVIFHIVDPRLLSSIASYDLASDICRPYTEGGRSLTYRFRVTSEYDTTAILTVIQGMPADGFSSKLVVGANDLTPGGIYVITVRRCTGFTDETHVESVWNQALETKI